MKKSLRLIDAKKDCILVYAENTGVYKVIDIENDVICMTKVEEQAYNVFSCYDLDHVRKDREHAFRMWMEQMVDTSGHAGALELGD